MLLVYRMPREPSTARVAVWRKLKRLGVAQLSDGVVALPLDARTREQMEWVAQEVTDGGGSAGVWLADPGTDEQERELALGMARARAEEYQAVRDSARAAFDGDEAERAQLVRRLRGELRRIERRDFYPPPQRADARAAVENLSQRDRPDDGAGMDRAAPGSGGAS